MKLLIITQKIDINDDNLGFFVRWVEEFAKNTEEVVVIANYVGEHYLPNNVKVLSLGKEIGFGRIHRYFNFYRYLLGSLRGADAVFVHMIPAWVILGWPLYFVLRKKVYFWYTHKSVTRSLRLAEKMVSKIFTASDKSFRLQSDKVMVMGHGIDIEKFQPRPELRGEKFRIITAGRISKAKNLDVLIEAANILKNAGEDFEVQIAGAPITKEDKKYFEKLKTTIKEKDPEDKIKFAGPIPYKNIEKFYQKGALFVNLSSTGSVDKAVLEAMACGLQVLTSNEAFFEILPDENTIDILNAESLAEKIKYIKSVKNPAVLRDLVSKNNNLQNLIGRIIQEMR